MTQIQPGEQEARQPTRSWLTKGVWGIGLASFLADVGHEVPTALFASLVTITLGAPAAVLGLIEGVADGLAGLARFAQVEHSLMTHREGVQSRLEDMFQLLSFLRSLEQLSRSGKLGLPYH